ncbi:hypothetical protein GA0070612_0962 [Micromonospora chokoriensis]|uniref:Uncharacterized protein n=1 Tax=Micromonospora chokoriensis TaxID=356851 RepID=A0A1C4V149_9ACTN|nr:hypothetical protein GA0070612_0962 [Micromonospora chokoriensis]
MSAPTTAEQQQTMRPATIARINQTRRSRATAAKLGRRTPSSAPPSPSVAPVTGEV